MNKIVARMLGEADFHSPEERAELDKAGGEASGSSEEHKEVALAKQIVTAAENKENEQVIKLAQELIRMHRKAKPEREGFTGEISPDDFQRGSPFRLSPKRDPRYGVKNVRPLSKSLDMLMALPHSQSHPTSP